MAKLINDQNFIATLPWQLGPIEWGLRFATTSTHVYCQNSEERGHGEAIAFSREEWDSIYYDRGPGGWRATLVATPDDDRSIFDTLVKRYVSA